MPCLGLHSWTSWYSNTQGSSWDATPFPVPCFCPLGQVSQGWRAQACISCQLSVVPCLMCQCFLLWPPGSFLVPWVLHESKPVFLNLLERNKYKWKRSEETSVKEDIREGGLQGKTKEFKVLWDGEVPGRGESRRWHTRLRQQKGSKVFWVHWSRNDMPVVFSSPDGRGFMNWFREYTRKRRVYLVPLLSSCLCSTKSWACWAGTAFQYVHTLHLTPHDPPQSAGERNNSLCERGNGLGMAEAQPLWCPVRVQQYAPTLSLPLFWKGEEKRPPQSMMHKHVIFPPLETNGLFN